MGQFFLAQNESRIYPNMCAKFGCGPTVVSKKKGGYRQADRQTKISAALYIVYIRTKYRSSHCHWSIITKTVQVLYLIYVTLVTTSKWFTCDLSSLANDVGLCICR